MLAKLRPDSWLHREVRRKIEEVFLRNDDQPGLVAYYERWTKKEPEDIEALVRLGRTLATMGRAAEALPWYEKAIKLAPTRRDLRLALISQLAGDQKFAEAAPQYQALDQADPNNPDTLRDWGALVLRDTTRPVPERRAAAASIWRKMLVPKPNDPVTTAQVADLLRQAEMTDDALALYKKAAELAPANPQYHEYIGEFLHNLKRPDQARAAWAKIADGTNKNPKNLARLAEVLAGFGYLKEAVPALSEAVKLEADNFDYHLKLADYLHRLERYDDAETELAAARRLAEKDEEKDAVLEARVKNDQAAGRLAQRIDSLQKELDNDTEPDRREMGCSGPLSRGRRQAPRGGPGRRAGDPGRAALDPGVDLGGPASASRPAAWPTPAKRLRRLAEIDRRNRTEHLMGIAKLETRLGRIDAALKAGRDLLAAAPGNPENYEFFAQLCFQLGKSEEGLDALRRAVRANPNDTKIVLALAETLAGQYQTDEAIEMYWRAFERADELDSKLDVVRRLTELYLQRNQLDRLLTRLEHSERDERPAADAGGARERDVAMCLAQALATSGDLGGARSELERLLAANNRDPHLLKQLSKLAEEEGDIESAARYQKLLIELAPSDEELSRLGELYRSLGRARGSPGGLVEDGRGQERDISRIPGDRQPARPSKAPAGRGDHRGDAPQRPERLGSSLSRGAGTGGAAQTRRGRQAVPGPARLDDRRRREKHRRQGPRPQRRAPGRQSRLAGCAGRGDSARAKNRHGVPDPPRLQPRPRPATATWSPDDFGQARMAALGWLMSLEPQDQPKTASPSPVSGKPPTRRRPTSMRFGTGFTFARCATTMRPCSRPPGS